MFFSNKTVKIVTPETALVGRKSAIPTADVHFVNGRPDWDKVGATFVDRLVIART